MFPAEGYSVNASGHLTIGGVDSIGLAVEYGTPLHVFNKEVILHRIAALQQCLARNYQNNGCISYMLKAFCCKEICRIAMEENLDLAAASGGELYTALSVGFPAARINFHGFNKTDQELAEAIGAGVGCIVVDSRREIELIDLIAGLHGVRQRIMLRILPGVTAGALKDTGIGQTDSRFGFPIDEDGLLDIVSEIMENDSLELVGLHCHIGSQVLGSDVYQLVAKMMLNLMDKMRQTLGLTLTELNMGGGFGIRYHENDQHVDGEQIFDRMLTAIRTHCEKIHYPLPKVTIEPGRYLVGESGTILYRVGCVKEIRSVRTYVGVDGGILDNARYILYGAKYDAMIANRATEEKSQLVTIAGKSSIGRDILGYDMPLQKPNVDDIVAFFATGAYTYSLPILHGRSLRPAIVLIEDGKPRVIVRRQDYADLVAMDL